MFGETLVLTASGSAGQGADAALVGEFQMRIQLAAIAGLALSLGFAAAAQAQVSVDVPGVGATWSSATTGSGTLSAGGQTGFMWTTGDFVSQTVTGTGLDFATEFADTFSIQNILGEDMTIGASLNGTSIGQFTIANCDFCEQVQQVSVDFTFAKIASDPGNFNVIFTLENTMPPGEGSLTFLEGGRGTLSGTGGVPEPASWALMIMGFGGLGAAMRRRRSLALA